MATSDGWFIAPPISSGRNPFRSAAAWGRRLRCTPLPLLSPPRGARRGPLFSFQKEKRKRAVHGPKEKRKYHPCGGARDGRTRLVCFRFLHKSPVRGVVLAGVWISSNRPAPLSAALALEGAPPEGRWGLFQAVSTASLAAARTGDQSMHRPPNPRSHYAAGRDLRTKQSVPQPRPRFLSSTVHGAFSLFAKERMGGALHQLAP